MQNNNQVQQFYSEEFGSINILMIDDRPYFPASECATMLGYKNPRKAVIDHCVKDGVTIRDAIDILGRTQEKNYISEGNLYRLIARSKLPSAVRFEKFIFDDVVPTIRKFGTYATSDTLDELLQNPRFAETLIQKLEEERAKNGNLVEQAAVWEELAIEMAPKALYCEKVLKAGNLFPVSVIAKDYGMGAAAFNLLLHDYGIQFRVGGTWLLYQQYAGCGYTHSTTYRIDDKIAAIHTRWTHKGRMFLYEFLKVYGILPLGEYRYDEPLPA
jgi:prophage antirepressor-like protein